MTSISPDQGEFDIDTRFTLTATDAGSGVNMTECKVDSGQWMNYTGEFSLPEGAHTVYFRSRDNLGNLEPENSIEVQVKGKLNVVGVLLPSIIIAILLVLIAAILLKRRRKSEADEPPKQPPETAGELKR
jgi:hypothetical protein